MKTKAKRNATGVYAIIAILALASEVSREYWVFYCIYYGFWAITAVIAALMNSYYWEKLREEDKDVRRVQRNA